MKQKIVEFFKDNFWLIIPSLIVLTVLTGFMIYGFQKPETVAVLQEDSITILQQHQEEKFIALYEEETHDETTPFFVLNPFGNSPLTGILMFETDVETQYTVVIKGKDTVADIEFVSKSATMHMIPIYGLYANYENTIELYDVSDTLKANMIVSKTVQTGPLYEEIVLPTEIETTHDYFNNDLMLYMPVDGGYPVGYDYTGEVRWYLTERFTYQPEVLANGHLLIGNDLLMNEPHFVSSIYEIDYLGKVYRDYLIPGGYHHDVEVLPSGNLLVLTNDFIGTMQDKIIEIDKNTGEILDTIDLEVLLPKTNGKAAFWTEEDWFHGNSLSYDSETDSIYVSGRNQDIIVNINKSTHDLNFVIGDPETFSTVFSDAYFLEPLDVDLQWQYAQTSVVALPNNRVMVFDNGVNRSKLEEEYLNSEDSYSRAVIYDIDPVNKTIDESYSFGQEEAGFYSPYSANVFYYDTDHYLIHSGGHSEVYGTSLNLPFQTYEGHLDIVYSSKTYEVLNDEIVYYMELEGNYLSATRVTLYNELTSYITGRGLVIGEPMETMQYTDEYETRFNLLDTVPLYYDLNIVKESDRLMIRANLDSDDEVYIILVKEEERLVYEMPTSGDSINHICLVEMIDEDQYITYYINETNVTGDYNIFIVINGREFNTYQHVEFN
jgi:arylsulfate sulfotransferase